MNTVSPPTVHYQHACWKQIVHRNHDMILRRWSTRSRGCRYTDAVALLTFSKGLISSSTYHLWIICPQTSRLFQQKPINEEDCMHLSYVFLFFGMQSEILSFTTLPYDIYKLIFLDKDKEHQIRTTGEKVGVDPLQPVTKGGD